MEFLLELFIEIFVQVIGDAIIEVISGPARRRRAESGETSVGWRFWSFLAWVAAGLVLGWLSTLVLPRFFLPPGPWRLANVILTPLLVAAAGAWVFKGRWKPNDPETVGFHACKSAAMCVALGLTRWALLAR